MYLNWVTNFNIFDLTLHYTHTHALLFYRSHPAIIKIIISIFYIVTLSSVIINKIKNSNLNTNILNLYLCLFEILTYSTLLYSTLNPLRTFILYTSHPAIIYKSYYILYNILYCVPLSLHIILWDYHIFFFHHNKISISLIKTFHWSENRSLESIITVKLLIPKTIPWWLSTEHDLYPAWSLNAIIFLMRSTYHMLTRHSLPLVSVQKTLHLAVFAYRRSFMYINTKNRHCNTHTRIYAYTRIHSVRQPFTAVRGCLRTTTLSRRICACILWWNLSRGPIRIYLQGQGSKSREINSQESDMGLSLHIFIVDESVIQIRINSKINADGWNTEVNATFRRIQSRFRSTRHNIILSHRHNKVRTFQNILLTEEPFRGPQWTNHEDNIVTTH